MTANTDPISDNELSDQEEELNKAIQELRGVLKEDGSRPAGAPGPSAAAAELAGASVIMNIPVDVQIVLGSAEMPVSDLMNLTKGSVVALDRRIGEAVDVMVNGRRIARGEITVMDDDPSRFGIRLVEIVQAKRQA